MLLTIPNVLDHQTLGLLRDALSRAQFVDGRLSAGKAAAKVKNNQELDRNASDRDRLNKVAMQALMATPQFQYAVLPHRVATPYFARYSAGMEYGDHVDDPIMGQSAKYRSDVSATLFLNEPDDYSGGELVIQTAFGPQTVKLPAGHAVVYPSSSLHRVAPVTGGTRLVMVTWVQSLVRSPEQRELLYDLQQAREALLDAQPGATTTAQVDRSYVNLVRMWSEV